MTASRQHHRAILTPRADKIDETRELLTRARELVTSKQPENGPTTWCASISEDGEQFNVDALFERFCCYLGRCGGIATVA